MIFGWLFTMILGILSLCSVHCPSRMFPWNNSPSTPAVYCSNQLQIVVKGLLLGQDAVVAFLLLNFIFFSWQVLIVLPRFLSLFNDMIWVGVLRDTHATLLHSEWQVPTNTWVLFVPPWSILSLSLLLLLLSRTTTNRRANSKPRQFITRERVELSFLSTSRGESCLAVKTVKVQETCQGKDRPAIASILTRDFTVSLMVVIAKTGWE